MTAWRSRWHIWRPLGLPASTRALCATPRQFTRPSRSSSNPWLLATRGVCPTWRRMAMALYGTVAKKLHHYARELAPGGPFAPGKGKFVPFVATDRGLLAPAASKLLKEFALTRTDVAGGGDGDPRSQASKAFRVNGARTISTVIQRWMACTVHAAATEFFELNNPPAASWPVDVDAPHMLRFLGPGQATRDLSALPPLELADIDVVGLQPVASMLG